MRTLYSIRVPISHGGSKKPDATFDVDIGLMVFPFMHTPLNHSLPIAPHSGCVQGWAAHAHGVNFAVQELI